VPFMERIFDLAISGGGDGHAQAGYTGQITSNSFMKRGFGKKLIEEYIPRWNLTHIIDASGAYIPGHGTPTVILFGRNAKPMTTTVRTVMGIRGEPKPPLVPAEGHVWKSILDLTDKIGSESKWISVNDTLRKNFQLHPWSLSGGGALDSKKLIDSAGEKSLGDTIEVTGITAVTGEDDLYIFPDTEVGNRLGIENQRSLVVGTFVRDFEVLSSFSALWPYNDYKLLPLSDIPASLRLLWPARAVISQRRRFGTPMIDKGLSWYEWQELYSDKLRNKNTIVFPDTSTNNHFSLFIGDAVFKSTAPVIKLKETSSIDDYHDLIGVLNSTVGCFWTQQLFHNKGGPGGGNSKDEKWHDFYQFNCKHLERFPLPSDIKSDVSRKLGKLAQESGAHSPDALTARDVVSIAKLTQAEQLAVSFRADMISLQEELDWQCYRRYGLIDSDDHLEWPEDRLDTLPPLTLGERAFEIRMARQMVEGDLETTWFQRHKDAGSKPITELPAHWSADYRALVERRLAFIEENKNLSLIERPEYKRRWNTEPWAKRQQAALEKWLLTRLETYFHDADRMVSGEDEAATAAKLAHIHPLRARFAGGGEPRLVSVRQLAQTAQADSHWMEAATVFAGRADFDLSKLVETLVLAESVPALPAQRYKPAGLRKRMEWEKTWELQRQEDAVEEDARAQNPEAREEELKALIRKTQQEKVGDIPVPPKYGSGDFLKSSYWKLRGKLDVPKERWVVYPGMEGGIDASPVIAWAGWDHAQQAQALTGFYQQATDTWGWEPQKLAPLLAALKDLLPWLHQWHNEIDPEYGDRISTTYQQFYDTERHTLRLTDEDIERIRMGGGNA